MEPATILGALAGTYANKLLASWITTTLLSAVMAYMTYTLLKKGIKGWALETARAVHQASGVSAPLLGSQDVQTAATGGGDGEGHGQGYDAGVGVVVRDGGRVVKSDVVEHKLLDAAGSGSDDLIDEQTEVGPLVHDLRRLSRAWSVQRQQQLPHVKIAVLVALFVGG